MEKKKEVKALQVRLPADVYDALQYEASAKGSTMNAVVVDCLRTNLPETHWTDFALVRDMGMFSDNVAEQQKYVEDALGSCQAKVVHEISLLNVLISLRAAQVLSLISISKSIRKGWEVSPPREISKNEAGHLNIGEAMKTTDTNNLAKTEEKVRDMLKALARARAESQIELRLFYTFLERMNRGGRPSNAQP